MVPEGYQPLARTSPYTALIGPLYSRGEGTARTLGLLAERKHCNARGAVHGGVLATLADIALGYAMAFSTTPPTSLVTANLTLDFAGAAREGDWLEARVDVQKLGGRLAFGNCYISRGEERIVRASAVFVVAGQLDEA